MVDRGNPGERLIFYLFFICLYIIGVALLKVILFEGLVKVPRGHWGSIYWYIAGAIFGLYVVPNLKEWYNKTK